jgi:hypothetical protein
MLNRLRSGLVGANWKVGDMAIYEDAGTSG